MKRIIRFSFALVVTLALLIGLFQLATDLSTNVGWNKGVGMSPPQSLQAAVCKNCAPLGTDITPNVGWNRGT